ncbi:XisI protein [Okeania sp.]|uniref:XisI protein n=1 Tax=Okeania sp. TaxID=3100323 RepID=UPI002B4AF223|nr:XisI protein [Okeania sp.]MEB3342614.1 XisI protein [Okeania sp.]
MQKSGDVRVETIFDTQHHHYLLVQVGSAKNHWVYGSIFHLDIIDNKIYIQQNNTEESVAERLVELEVSQENIVIDFYSPFKRKFTDYAVN